MLDLLEFRYRKKSHSLAGWPLIGIMLLTLFFSILAAFSSFKTPSEVPIAPGVGGYARWPQSSPVSGYINSFGFS